MLVLITVVLLQHSRREASPLLVQPGSGNGGSAASGQQTGQASENSGSAAVGQQTGQASVNSGSAAAGQTGQNGQLHAGSTAASGKPSGTDPAAIQDAAAENDADSLKKTKTAAETPDAWMTYAVPGEEVLAGIPEYSGEPAIILNNNKPYFCDSPDIPSVSAGGHFYFAGEDALGRNGTAAAVLQRGGMPAEERESSLEQLESIHPSGWQNAKYDWIEGEFLYNRCHLIGYQLIGEETDPRNRITGTRYFNMEGMLPYEDEAAWYVRRRKQPALFRVTPIYRVNNLVAEGVVMEAMSLNDGGNELSFCVFVYNVQPGVYIQYADGWNEALSQHDSAAYQREYVLNTSSMKFHRPDCDAAAEIWHGHRKVYIGDRQDLIGQDYAPCGRCRP